MPRRIPIVLLVFADCVWLGTRQHGLRIRGGLVEWSYGGKQWAGGANPGGWFSNN